MGPQSDLFRSDVSRSSGAATSPKMYFPSKYLTPILTLMSPVARKKLKDVEFYLNWLVLPNEIMLHENEVEGIISFLKNEANERFLPREEDSLKLMRTHGLKPIVLNNVLAFMWTLQEEYALADDCLAESNRLLDVCLNSLSKPVIPMDHLLGTFYVVKGLKAFLENCTGSMGDIFNIEHFLMEAVEDFENLPAKSKAAVLMEKRNFLKLILKRNPETVLLDEILALDPDYYEWRLQQYEELRELRIFQKGRNSCPDEKEVEAVVAAWNNAHSNPQTTISMCICVTELLRNKNCAEGEQWRLTLGHLAFFSVVQTVNWIKDTCRNVLKTNPHSVKLNHIVSEIVGNLMPFRYRDFYMARECIFQAFRFGEKVSSAANFQLAIWMLEDSKPKIKEPQLFEGYLEQAYALNSRNFDAVFYLLVAYLSRPKAKFFKIRTLFANTLCNFDITDQFRNNLLFLKGCFHMLVDEVENALMTWASIYITYGSRIEFKALQTYSFLYRVFQWDYATVNLPRVAGFANQCLQNFSAQPDTPEKLKQALSEMLSDILLAVTTDLRFEKLLRPAPTVEQQLAPLMLPNLNPEDLLLDPLSPDSGVDVDSPRTPFAFEWPCKSPEAESPNVSSESELESSESAVASPTSSGAEVTFDFDIDFEKTLAFLVDDK